MYELRDRRYAEWLEATSIELPVATPDRIRFEDAMNRAFNAGWASRKAADYALLPQNPARLPADSRTPVQEVALLDADLLDFPHKTTKGTHNVTEDQD